MEYSNNLVASEQFEESAQRLMDLSDEMVHLDEDIEDIAIRLQVQIDTLVSLKQKLQNIRIPKIPA